MQAKFEYGVAFGRNIGLISEAEQVRLRNLRVGVAGLGGVGGAHLQVLARMGVGAFHLADPDHFEVANFNRQFGATMQTVGSGKAEVSASIMRAINPEAQAEIFDAGISPACIDRFLRGVNIVIDGIEFFRMEDRRLLYRECRARGIPVVNAGPIGYGAAVIVFSAQTPSFDEYFRIRDGMTRAQKLIAFGIGLGPGLTGDIDPRYVSFEREKGPALASACCLCAGSAATEVVKLATGRGQPALAPNGWYVDLLRGRTIALTPPPDLLSPDGAVVLEACFARFPELRRMHEQETPWHATWAQDAPASPAKPNQYAVW